MVLQKQAAVDPLTILSNQLTEASASSERLRYDMQTLKMENTDIRAKFEAAETEYDRIKSKYRSLSECHEEMMTKKNRIISENQFTISKLQCVVDELKQSESKTRQAELEKKKMKRQETPSCSSESIESTLLWKRKDHMREAEIGGGSPKSSGQLLQATGTAAGRVKLSIQTRQ